MIRRGEIFAPENPASSLFENLIVDTATCIESGKSDPVAARKLAVVSTTAAGRGARTHNNVLRSNTGWALDPVAWARRAAAAAKLMEQNDRIADALQRAGEDVIKPGGLTLISAVTNIVETQRVFRAVRFLPVVAARDRRPLVNGLKLFIQEHPNARYFRYAVMTCSEPIPAFGDLRESVQDLSRRISKWAHEMSTPDEKGQRYDIAVLFRGIEFTRATAAERDAAAAQRGQKSNLTERYGADTVLYHVHANVLYWPKRNIEKLWSKFLKGTENAIGAHWRDNGRVQKVEEIVKYCSKPADTLKATDDELVWLYQQTQRLKFCQPLGEFRAWMKTIEERREKVVRVHVGQGDGRLMRVKKGKRGGKQESVNESAYLHENEAPDVNAIKERETEREAADDRPPKLEREVRHGGLGGSTNIVIGVSLPQWRHTPWSEPMILVQNYDPLKLSSEDAIDIREWQRQARVWWDEAFAPEPAEALRVASMAMDAVASSDDIREAAEAAPYIVHTCSPTVPTGTPNHFGDLEIEDEEDLDDDMRAIISLFPGAKFVQLRLSPATEDDLIPYEAPEREKRWSAMRADLAEREAEWAQRLVPAALDGRMAA